MLQETTFLTINSINSNTTTTVHTTLRTIRRARSEMQKIIGREPSLPELSHHLSIPIEKIRLYNDSSRSTISLNSPLNPSSGGGGSGTGLSNSKGDSGSNNASISASGEMDRRTLGDKIAFDGPTPEEDAEMQSLKRDIRDVIDGLGSERERDVLFFRFGLEGAGEPCTLEETGRRLGISRERVKVIENRALNKLRHPQRNYRLKEYVEEGNHGHGNGNGNGLGYVYGVSPPPASVGGQQQLGNNGKGQEWQKEAVGIDLYGEQRMDTMTKKRGGKKSVRKGKDGDALAKQRPEQIWSF
jgi:RNA polymerase sigma factor (sigma-70 family)